MKRRVLSFVVTLALCLNLCPVWVLAAGGETGGGLCSHHPEHTDGCGYVLPELGQECTHDHGDACYTAETVCIHEHTAECYPGDASGADEPALCAHVCTEDSGCVTQTLSCLHEHDGFCGYVPENPGAPCTFVCPVCPIEDLIASLPRSISEQNSEQVRAQLDEIYERYDGLTEEEQQQVDLSPCAALLEQIDGLGSEVLGDGESSATNQVYTMNADKSIDTAYPVLSSWIINTNGYTLTASNSNAIQVTETGTLDLRGNVVSKKGAGVEVMKGGVLIITDPGTDVKGSMYALDIASGAEVRLSAGTYFGKSSAIRTEDGDFAALLAEGCAYFDANGAPILPADMANVKTVVVGPCTEHADKSYVHNPGTTEHTWTCPACGAEDTAEKCTFDFDSDGNGTCGLCGNEITIEVDRESLKDLAYDDTIQPANGTVTVTVKDASSPLTLDTDYSVSYSTQANVGSSSFTVKVTVEGKAYNGTFIQEYTFTKDDLTRPVLQWATTSDVSLPYTGSEVTKDQLPDVTINITSTGVDLHDQLQYSYKAQGSAAYTDGLPTNAGTYEVVVSLPDGPDFQAVSSEPLTLIVTKISPILTAPEAKELFFNRTAQELVTGGTLHPAAARDGVEIKFAKSETGPYSTAIPTGINAGTYTVWYQTDATDNYEATPATEVTGVLIQRKPIMPVVTLSDYTYLYDGGYKQPAVTVKDEDHVTVLLDTEYKVTYQNNRDVGTAKVVVTDQTGGNYDITTVEVEFQITSRTQETLSITQKPNTIIYGDQFTLSTSGGSGNGDVTWEITSGTDVATADRSSGQVTIIGHGSATVKATKSGEDPAPVTRAGNYENAIASWTFTAEKKPVTATVTAEDKSYDGDTDAVVQAVVEQGVLAGDVITITGLTGTFNDENAGVDKTVNVNVTGATIIGKNSEHYIISYSSATTAVKATIHKATASITAPTAPASLTYNAAEQELIAAGAVVNPSTVQAEYALSEAGPYSTDFPKGTNAGTYTVWYRVQDTDNYTGQPPAKIDVTIAQKTVTPTITLSGDGLTTELDGTYSYIYDGSEKRPDVTLTEADGTIPNTEYTVAYSDNINVSSSAAVTVTAKNDGNYSFAPVTQTFTIQKEKATIITTPKPAGKPLVFDNMDLELVTPGTGSGGTMVYSVDDENGTYEAAIPTGFDAAEYTVYYKVKGDANHSDSDVDSVKVTIASKTVKDPTIELFDGSSTLSHYTYDGNAKEPAVKVIDGSTEIDPDEYKIVYSDNVDAGRATVNITAKTGGNYTVTGSATFVIVPADIEFNPTPSAADITYDGKAHELLVPGVTSGGEVLYALGSATSTYNAAIPTAADAGNYTVYYKVIGDKNHNDYAIDHVDVTIKRKPLAAVTIELTPNHFEYDGTVKMPQVTVKDGKTVLPEEEYAWTCDTPDPTGEGTYTITVTDAPDGNYDLSGITASTAVFSIGMAEQKPLVIEGIPNATIYGDKFQLSASGGSSGSAIIWSVTGTAADVDQATGAVEITGVGEVTIKATNPGDANYRPVSKEWTFTAAPKPITASVAVANRAYDKTTAAAVSSADISAGLLDKDKNTVEVVLNSIAASFDTPNVGTEKTVTLDVSNVQVSGTNADKYAISYPATVKADIMPRAVDVTITLSDSDLQQENDGTYFYDYDGTAKTPAVTVTVKDETTIVPGSEYEVNYSNNKNAGSATVTVTAKEDGNYTFTSGTTISFTIKSAGPQLTTSPQANNLTYTGQPQELVTVGTASGGHVEYSLDDIDYKEEIPTGTAAGPYVVYYKVVGDANHTGSTKPGQVSVTIKQKEIITPVITLAQDSYTYNGSAYEPTVTVQDGKELIDGDEYSVSYRNNVNAGTATVIVSDKSGGNYIVNGTANFEITKADPTFTPPEGITGLQYNGALQELVKAGVSHEGTVVYSVNGGNDSTAIPTAAAVGQYTITYKVLGDANHSDTAPVTLTVDIGKNTVTVPKISLSSNRFTFNNSQQKPTITVLDDNNRLIPKQEYNITITGTKSNNMVDVDIYTIKITTPDTSNYDITDDDKVNVRTFEIVEANQETISITGIQAQVCYGDVIQLGTTGGTGSGTITWTITGSGSINSTISSKGGLLTVKDVGGPITVTATRSGVDNYSDIFATWEFSAGKKPVTAVLTGVDKSFDGTRDATVKAEVAAGDLVFGDTFRIPDLTGAFDNENVGTNKTITITGSAPTLSDPKAANYEITYPRTAAASILAKTATMDPAPSPVSGLTYDASKPQALVTAGTTKDGIMVYSLDGVNFTPAIPKGEGAGTYTVYYKVQGDNNHTDSAMGSFDVTIEKQTVAPQIELTPSSVQYDGNVKRPKVTVRDGENNIIPYSENESESEYRVIYVSDSGENWKDQGTYQVRIEDVPGGNYVVNPGTANFIISKTPQNQLTIVSDQPGPVYYGDKFTLKAMGGSGSGAVTWSSSDENIADIDGNGFVTIKGTGAATITATKAGDNNYSDPVEATYPLNAWKKPVTASITADDKVYDGDVNATIHVTWEKGALVGNDKIDTSALKGTFADERVGTGKTVTISGMDQVTSTKYEITIPADTTASIFKAVATPPVLQSNNRVYDGTSQPLVTGGNDKKTLYAETRDGAYISTVPVGTNAGPYTVWYKEKGDDNYNDSEPQPVLVTIRPKSLAADRTNVMLSGSGLQTDSSVTPPVYFYTFDGEEKKPNVVVMDGSNTIIPEKEYTVSYLNHVQVGENAAVIITDAEGGNYIVNGSVTFAIRPGAVSLETPPQANNLTYTGSPLELVTPGTAVNGRVVYSKTENGSYSTLIPKETDAGDYEVWYKVEGNNGASGRGPYSVPVTIQPQKVTPMILLDSNLSYSAPYTGSPIEPAVTVVVDGDVLTEGYTVSYSNHTNVGTATVIVKSTDGNYKFFAIATFEITKAKAAFEAGKEPTPKTLVYTGKAQPLVNAGVPEGGIAYYSLDGTSYSALIPTGVEVGPYTVYAKVQGDSRHEDSDVIPISVTIGTNTVANPTVTLSATTFNYTGFEQKPTITVIDPDHGNEIPATEYTVTYQGNTINPGTYELIITGNGNRYSFGPIKEEITIVGADQSLLTITGKQDNVFYGDSLHLGATGGSGSGAVTWSSSNEDAAAIDNNGVVTIKKSGSVTITATKAAEGGYNEASDTWTVHIKPKPVTAVVTAADKTYNKDAEAQLTVTISKGLVPGETVDVSAVSATGHFLDEKVGQSKTVIVESLVIPPEVQEKYDIDWNTTATASITPKTAEVGVAPEAVTDLKYTGSPQALVTSGTVQEGGNLVYSRDGVSYKYDLPTAVDVGSYDVWYKVLASDENYKDSAPVKVENVAIGANTDPPNVLCTPGTSEYDGKEKTPTVVVRDQNQRIIPESEYTVTYADENGNAVTKLIAVGKYTVTVTDKPGGNYEFTSPAMGSFEITPAGQNPLTIVTDKATDVYYGETIRLSAMGGSGNGAIQWSINDDNVAVVTSNSGNNCVVTVKGTGGFTVTASRAADGGYSESNEDTVVFFANPKPVTPVVTAANKPYDGNCNATLNAAWKSGDLVGSDEIELTVTGEFLTADVGIGKQVKVVPYSATGKNSTDVGKYDITWPESTTASIEKVDAKLADKPVAAPNLKYTGSTYFLLVNGGATENNIGKLEYSLREKGEYSSEIPTGTDAGTYTVWYRVADSVNYTGIPAASIEVKIAKATPTISTPPTVSGTAEQPLSAISLSDVCTANVPGEFAWDDGSIILKNGASGASYKVIFTPDDTTNYETVTSQIPVTVTGDTSGSDDTSGSGSTDGSGDSSGSGGTGGGSDTSGSSGASTDGTGSTYSQPKADIQNGTASAVVSAADGGKLVDEAIANQSQTIVIKPEIASDVIKTEVAIPASTVSRIKSETNAALTVSSPIADVTIPHAALDTLSRSGEAVNVVTEQVGQSVVLTLTAGGETLKDIPGGVTLTVPAADAGPGTVAVLLHDDGTREILRKSIAGDGKVSIPLNGSAAVAIVDNSKDFADVPPASWAADAVAFASAHELFNGTSETTFSPDQAMSRGMLATVLYNLEGRPAQALTSEFSDVSSDTWYADSIAWAAENGITNGYGDGQFGPNDSITREQFVVMLWKYAGSPEAREQNLAFTDADQASGYAQKALCWAVENGILSGYANGQLAPGGTATRAQAAQMLKNFMENV